MIIKPTDDLTIFLLTIDALAGALLVGVGVGIFPIVEIITDFDLPVPHGVDVLSCAVVEVWIAALADVLAGVIIGVVEFIVTKIAVDVNANVSTAVMTAFGFVMSALLKESIPFC